MTRVHARGFRVFQQRRVLNAILTVYAVFSSPFDHGQKIKPDIVDVMKADIQSIKVLHHGETVKETLRIGAPIVWSSFSTTALCTVAACASSSSRKPLTST
jgi:hypothetical protein